MKSPFKTPPFFSKASKVSTKINFRCRWCWGPPTGCELGGVKRPLLLSVNFVFHECLRFWDATVTFLFCWIFNCQIHSAEHPAGSMLPSWNGNWVFEFCQGWEGLKLLETTGWAMAWRCMRLGSFCLLVLGWLWDQLVCTYGHMYKCVWIYTIKIYGYIYGMYLTLLCGKQ